MSLGDYLTGFAFALATAALVGAATAIVVRRRLRGLRGAPLIIACAIIAISLLLAAHVVPLALGILSRESVLATALVLFGAAALVRRSHAEIQPDPSPPKSGTTSRVVAALALTILTACYLARLRHLAPLALDEVDMTTFHLPVVARWIQSGSAWGIEQFIPGRAEWAYPHNGDTLVLWSILPWRSDFLARFVDVPLLALTGLGTYVGGLELKASRARAVLMAVVLLSIPAVSFIALQGLSDTLMLAGFTCGLAFLLRHRRSGRTSDLVLAGLALGIAFGSKWYGVSAVVLLLIVWTVNERLSGVRSRTALRHLGMLAGLTVLMGGFWLLRNWVEAGNPVYPLKVTALGVTVFDAPRHPARELIGFPLSDYLLDWRIWRRYLLPDFMRFMATPAILLWVCLPAALVAATMMRRARANLGLIATLFAAALAIAVAYLFTPFTGQGPKGEPLLAVANARYVVPALAIAAPLGAWFLGRLGRVAIAGELIALISVIDGARRWTETPAGEVAIAALGLGAAIAIALTARRGWSRLSPGPSRKAAITAAALLALVAAVALGALQQRRFNDARYLGEDPAIDWVALHARSGHRIALAGEGSVPSFIYPAFGPRLQNHVRYAGPIDRGMLRFYTQRDPFLARLRQGRYDLLIVERDTYFYRRLIAAQERWALEAGFRPLVSTPHFALLHAP